MPSIEQCDVASGNVAALPSTLEIFDKFKPRSENGNSDSEESFHLLLEEDDAENQSVVSNGKDKEAHSEENEDDILNKIEDLPGESTLEPVDEDSILNDVDESHDNAAIGEKPQSNGTKAPTQNIKVQIINNLDEDYENSADGEFKSVYELDCEAAENEAETRKNTKKESMEVSKILSTEQTEIIPECTLSAATDSAEQEDVEMSSEDQPENRNLPESTLSTTEDNGKCETVAVDQEDVEMLPENRPLSKEGETATENQEDVEMSSDNQPENRSSCAKEDTDTSNQDCLNAKTQQFCEDPPDVVEKVSENMQGKENCESTEGVETQDTENVDLDTTLTAETVSEGPRDDAQNLLLVSSTTINEQETESNTDSSSEKAENNTKNSEQPESSDSSKPPKIIERTNSETPSESKDSNDEESDLLDVSMVRETEEDDACAIADAIEESTAVAAAEDEHESNEKSDEEQSDRMEVEQESSDVDKDRDSNDDNSVGFDGLVQDDSSVSADLPVVTPLPNVAIAEEASTEPEEVQAVETSAVVKESEEEEGECEQPLVIDEGSSADKPETVQEDPTVTSDEKTEDERVEKTEEHEDQDGSNDAAMEINSEDDCAVVESPVDETVESTEHRKSLNKRTHSASDSEPTTEEVSAKRSKLSIPEPQPDTISIETETLPVEAADAEEEKTPQTPENPSEKLKTLTAFAQFMQCRKLTAKLSRSDLEQFCIQKICESLMLKSTEGELSQTIKKQEKMIETLKKDLLQLSKQCKDLEIVNKKLMNELRSQNGIKKPLVPLKITRSVGLQVRLNPANEMASQPRRRQPILSTPPKAILPNNLVNKAKPTNVQQQTVTRQIVQSSPQKSPLVAGQTTTAPMLTQALQKRAIVAKRTTTPVRKPADNNAAKPGAPGVIDLTDEDDRLNRPGSGVKLANKTASPVGTPNKTVVAGNKTPATKTVVNNQGKQMAVSNRSPLGPNKGNNLSPGIRLTQAITTTANGSPQMLYVVPTLASNNGGQQKVAFVNFQSSNGVLSSLNGSTVLANNKGQTLTLKTVPVRHKHPAPLPATRVIVDPKLKPLLPKPLLTIKKIDTGIILQWKMPYNLDMYESIASYQLYAYQETNAPPSTDMWRKVGDVKALALPMACTLTQFADKNKYYFAVRSVDVHKRIGAFSDPEEISL